MDYNSASNTSSSSSLTDKSLIFINPLTNTFDNTINSENDMKIDFDNGNSFGDKYFSHNNLENSTFETSKITNHQ